MSEISQLTGPSAPAPPRKPARLGRFTRRERGSGGPQAGGASAPGAWVPGPILELPATRSALRVFLRTGQLAKESWARLVRVPRLKEKVPGTPPGAGRGNDPAAAVTV